VTTDRPTSRPPSSGRNDAYWREYLEHPDTLHAFGRQVLGRIPADPRCQLCAAPFAGPGAPVMRLIGKRQSDGNPNMCTSCQTFLIKYHGGAEVEGTLLFADIRGSTSIAEHMSATEYRALLDRFYTTATRAVFAHNGIVDKFVGDELVAQYAPMMGLDHARRAVDTAQSLLRATGHADAGGPWVPVGAAVHTGRMWFGAVGEGIHTEITIVGDAVNTTARLASQAAAGEILVSTDAALAAGLDPTLERRSLALKGKELTTEVVSLKVQPS
jgi:adenylate cyclase